MKLKRAFLVMISALLMPGLLYAAENVDVVDPNEVPVPTLVPDSVTPPPGYEVLYENGPLITNPGAGPGGFDLSLLQSSLGLGTYGWGNQLLSGNWVADNFSVPPGGWPVTGFGFYGYQTNAGAVTPTIDDCRVLIFNGPPGVGSLVFGDQVTNRLDTSMFANIYRNLDTNQQATNRAVWLNVCMTDLYLPAGEYWVAWQLGGSPSFSGPWAPPITVLGQTTTGNGLQSIDNGGSWDPVLDTALGTAQGFPFQVYGAPTEPFTGRFEVNKITVDGNPGEVEVTLTCNTGVPLTQSAMISGAPGDPGVVFVVEELIPGGPDDFWCEIEETGGLPGYVALAVNHALPPGVTQQQIQEFAQVHHGEDWPESCMYEGIEAPAAPPPDLPEFHEGPEIVKAYNLCYFINQPHPVEVDVTKTWDISNAGGDAYDTNATIRVKSPFLKDGEYYCGDGNWCSNLDFTDDEMETQSVWIWAQYWESGGVDIGVPVYFEELSLDSAVESSNDCDGMIRVKVGESGAGCSFHNVLFFEGIPTLSQYGLAIMALLMLGVGFIGFRRFV